MPPIDAQPTFVMKSSYPDVAAAPIRNMPAKICRLHDKLYGAVSRGDADTVRRTLAGMPVRSRARIVIVCNATRCSVLTRALLPTIEAMSNEAGCLKIVNLLLDVAKKSAIHHTLNTFFLAGNAYNHLGILTALQCHPRVDFGYRRPFTPPLYFSPLSAAIYSDNIEYTKAVLGECSIISNINAVTYSYGFERGVDTALTYLIGRLAFTEEEEYQQRMKNGIKSAVLQVHNIDVNQCDGLGQTPLTLCDWYTRYCGAEERQTCNTSFMKLLLAAKGVDVHTLVLTQPRRPASLQHYDDDAEPAVGQMVVPQINKKWRCTIL